MKAIKHAQGAGQALPTSESAHVASAGRVEDQKKRDSADFRADGIAGQARSGIKRLIVFAASCGLLPAALAQSLIERGGLAHD